MTLTPSVLGLLSRVVRLVSIVAVVLIAAGLLGLLTDEIRNTSKVEATRVQSPGESGAATVLVDITQPNPPATVEKAREKQHTSAREAIDDAGDVIMAPFTSIAKGSEPWVRRLLYSGLALLLYGLLLQVLADKLSRLAEESRRRAFSAREAEAAAKRKESGTYASPA
jgi:hypothetical protein